MTTVAIAGGTGEVGRQIADGGLLPGDGAMLGTETYHEWLAAHR